MSIPHALPCNVEMKSLLSAASVASVINLLPSSRGRSHAAIAVFEAHVFLAEQMAQAL